MFVPDIEDKGNVAFQKKPTSFGFLSNFFASCDNNGTITANHKANIAIRLLKDLLDMHIFNVKGELYLSYFDLESRYNCSRSVIVSTIKKLEEIGLLRRTGCKVVESKNGGYEALRLVSLDIGAIMRHTTS